MRYIRRGFVVPALAALLIFFALPHPRDAFAAIDRDPYGLEKADKIAPGWLEARMKTYLADLWFERGEQYHFGKGVKTNFKASFQWYTKAVALDHIGAQFMVGEAYHCGHGAERNFNLAVEWYKKSMALGHAKGYHALGHLYSEEKQEGFVQDIEQAHELWRKAGEIGFPGLGLESHLENPHHFKC